MTAWTTDELDKMDTADELEIASLRADGTLRNPTTIWVVRLRDDVYVRSVNGRTGSWFRGAQDRHEARIQAGGIGKDVLLVETGELGDEIDAAYRTKYRRYAPALSAPSSPRKRQPQRSSSFRAPEDDIDAQKAGVRVAQRTNVATIGV